ncbi:MAG: PAQR family membrane homeostasis protein TrhA [Hyphomicrobiaceae bacterium]
MATSARPETMNFAFPEYTRGERVVDLSIHAVAIIGSLVGVSILLAISIDKLPGLSIAGVAIYCAGLLAVFCCSAAYNFVRRQNLKAIFRRLDQAAIYIKIAATYTPFAALKMASLPGTGLLTVVWVIAIFGMTVKLWFPERLIKTSYALYLALGWAALVVAQPLAASVSGLTLLMLCLGGMLYTIGVIFHFWISLPYHNAIWHAFVLAGSSCHYVAVLDSVAFS